MNIQIEEIESDLRRYLHQVEAGETLTIFEGDHPLAEIKPVSLPLNGKQRRPFGLENGEFIVPDDFDDPLPEEVLKEFSV